MKKTYIYASLFAATMTMAACDEDYTDWAEPQSYGQEGQMGATQGSLANIIASIDEATSESVISLASANTNYGSARFVSLKLGDVDVPFVSNDNVLVVNASDLRSVVRDAYQSLSATTRELEFTTSVVSFDEDGQALATPLADNKFKVSYKTASLPANASEDAYYYVGGYNGWNLASPTKFDSKGDGVYSLTITIGDGEWFAFAPQSAVDNEDWNALFRAPSNGCTDIFGYLDSDQTSGFSFQCETGGTYTFTLDMVNYTYSIVPYVAALYYAGDANGWSFSPMIKKDDDFVGYYYVNKVDNSSTWGFKVCTANNWDEPQYGQGASAGTIELGGGNIDLGQEDGFYKIAVNQASLSVALTPVKVISLIGSAVNGDSTWSTDADMTFNTETKVWEITTDLTAGEYKFRADHDWSLSWGGEDDALTSDSGANRKIDADGNYTITFAPNADGYGVATVKKN